MKKRVFINPMKRFFVVMASVGISAHAQTITEFFGSGANQFQIDFVQIGNPGNAADTTGDPSPVGSVGYAYNIGKYEISRDQVLKANSAGGLGITLSDMSFFGSNGPNRPATGVSWNEAARFVNWLNISKGYHAAYNFTTGGANDNITLWGAGQYNGTNMYRHKDAYYFLPSADEWYKAAYGSPNGVWYDFPNGSDEPPQAVVGGTSGAVFGRNWEDGPVDVTDAGGLSPYGTMGQGGNVWEWNETADHDVNVDPYYNRVLRGGVWESNIGDLVASRTSFGTALDENDGFGFRIASAPEPSSFSLLMIVGGAWLIAGKRRKD